MGNVHDVAQRQAPATRVAYVDIDPVAVAHSRAILAGNDRTAVPRGDLRDPASILADPALGALLDLDRPVAVLAVAVLHFVGDGDDPAGALGRLLDAVPAGSHLVLSHASHEGQPDRASTHQTLYQRTGTPMTMRSREQVERFFDGLELVEPGVVYLPGWRPDPGPVDEHPERFTGFAGVARKP